jgi:hypothetical protein
MGRAVIRSEKTNAACDIAGAWRCKSDKALDQPGGPRRMLTLSHDKKQ